MGHTNPEEEPFIYLMKKIQVTRDMLLDTSSQVGKGLGLLCCLPSAFAEHLLLQSTNYLRRTTCRHEMTLSEYEPLDENDVSRLATGLAVPFHLSLHSPIRSVFLCYLYLVPCSPQSLPGARD